MSTALAIPARRSIVTPAIALGTYAVMATITVALIPLAIAGGTVLSDPILTSPLILSLEIVIAALILRRHPRHPIGWLLAVHSIGMTSFAATIMYVVVAIASPTPLPFADAAYWYARWAWWPFWLLLFVPLLFPDGRLPSRRWASVAAIDVVVIVALVVSEAFAPLSRTLSGRTLPPNAFVADAGLIDLLRLVVALGIPLAALLSVAALVVRYRGGDRTIRSQLKWVLLGVSAVIVLFMLVGAAGPALIPRPLVVLMLPFTILVVPVSIGIAILRYRLYDIDPLINRTLVYGAVSTVLAATYFGAVVLFQALLRPFTGSSEFAVAGSTLLVVALFQPLRGRIQDIVDRRFYRARYDAVRTLDAFSARLRNEVDIDSVRGDLVGVVGETMRPAHASVWLRGAKG